MTKQKAIKIAKDKCKRLRQYIDHNLEYDKNNSDISENQIGTRITRLVVDICEHEIQTLEQIIDNLSKKHDHFWKAKPLRH